MATLTRDGATITVPADTVADYVAQGWVVPGSTPKPRSRPKRPTATRKTAPPTEEPTDT